MNNNNEGWNVCKDCGHRWWGNWWEDCPECGSVRVENEE